jgi:hypothetical protein
VTLPAEDLAIIRSDGVPLDPDPRYVVAEPGRKVRFTARGRQMYRMAMIIHGLDPEPVEHARTFEDLRVISLAVKSARLTRALEEAERALLAGNIPARSRAMLSALLYGPLKDFRAALVHGPACHAVGSNVIPLPRHRSARR